MQSTDIRNPNERNKVILAGALGLIAIVFLWWAFFGFGSSSTKVAPRAAAQPTPPPFTRRTITTAAPDEFKPTDPEKLVPVVFPGPPATMPEARRNIFVYYEKPHAPVV